MTDTWKVRYNQKEWQILLENKNEKRLCRIGPKKGAEFWTETIDILLIRDGG